MATLSILNYTFRLSVTKSSSIKRQRKVGTFAVYISSLVVRANTLFRCIPVGLMLCLGYIIDQVCGKPFCGRYYFIFVELLFTN